MRYTLTTCLPFIGKTVEVRFIERTPTDVKPGSCIMRATALDVQRNANDADETREYLVGDDGVGVRVDSITSITPAFDVVPSQTAPGMFDVFDSDGNPLAHGLAKTFAYHVQHMYTALYHVHESLLAKYILASDYLHASDILVLRRALKLPHAITDDERHMYERRTSQQRTTRHVDAK